MARLPRYFLKGQPQNVIQRGIDGQTIFFEEEDYQYYLECLYDAAKNFGLAIHAYTLMPTHVHLLATPKEKTSMSKTLQSVGRRYVQHFNYAYDRTGTLWEGRYKATLIEPEEYLFNCMRYIELNPVRHDIVKQPKGYLWSSYLYNAMGEEDPLVTPHRLYKKLAEDDKGRQAAYRAMFRKRLSEKELDEIRDATNKAWALGSDRFKGKIQKQTGRRSVPLPRGRPRKIAV